MIGIELTVDGTPIVDECLKRQLLINCTHGTVLRLLPALNLTDEQLRRRSATSWKMSVRRNNEFEEARFDEDASAWPVSDFASE